MSPMLSLPDHMTAYSGLLSGGGVGSGRLELRDGQVPALERPRDQVLGDLGYVVGVVDRLDPRPR